MVELMVFLLGMLCKKGNNIWVKNVLCENNVIGFRFLFYWNKPVNKGLLDFPSKV